MKSPLQNTQWKPDGRVSSRPPSRRKIIVILMIAAVVWLVPSLLIESLNLVEDPFKNGLKLPLAYNHVEITNDLPVNVYFVPCVDAECKDTPGGTHPADYGLVTTGHSQKLKVVRSQDEVVTFQVINDLRITRGCLHFLSTKEKLDVVQKNLSSVIQACEGPKSPKTQTTTTSSAPGV